MNFQNKTAIVTGGANGIGRALSMELVKLGTHVCIIDNDDPGIQDTQNLLKNYSESITIYAADLSQPGQVKETAAKIIEEHSGIDFLFNNAAVSIDAELILHSEEDIAWITQINYLTPLFLSYYMLPSLLKSESGGLVFISSAAGLQGFPWKSTYSASKFALTGLYESLSAELFDTNVTVAIAYLGPVQTHMLDRSRFSDISKKDKINKYLSQKGVTPEYAANKILNAVKKKQGRVLISKQSKTLDFFKRVMPSFFNRQIGKRRYDLPA